MKTLAYLLIDNDKIPVLVRPGKRGVYIVKRAAAVSPTDKRLEEESAFLSLPENRRLVKLLEEGKTLYL